MKVHLLLISLLCVSAFCWCINRDIGLEKQYGCDLRNRVVGARLQLDGKLPYFYKWKPPDGVRYYDPIIFDTTYANAITASPFFHHLLYPIANLPQRQISRIWLGVQYGLFICCLLIAFSFTTTIQQRWAVAVTAIMWLFSSPWITHIYYGQIYLFFAFLSLAFFFFFRRQHNLWFAFLAGLTAVVLVLSRPTMVIFFIPFLFFITRYSRKYLLVFFTPVFLLLAYVTLTAKERNWWIDYKKGIAAQVKDHQSKDHAARINSFKPIQLTNWEGWNIDSINKEKQLHPLPLKIEFAAVPAIAKNVFHKEISYSALTVSYVFFFLLFITLFYLQQKKDPTISITEAAILGFCLYMLSDLFSPVARSEYYALQWACPLLLCASFYNKQHKLFHFLLTLGLLLLVLNTPIIKMRHTMGEYLILLCLLWFSLFKRKPRPVRPGRT